MLRLCSKHTLNTHTTHVFSARLRGYIVIALWNLIPTRQSLIDRWSVRVLTGEIMQFFFIFSFYCHFFQYFVNFFNFLSIFSILCHFFFNFFNIANFPLSFLNVFLSAFDQLFVASCDTKAKDICFEKVLLYFFPLY